jgi:hypothetical protein
MAGFTKFPSRVPLRVPHSRGILPALMRKFGLFSSSLADGFRGAVFAAWIIAFLPLFASTTYAQTGARTFARSLDQLVDESAVIVRGHIVSARIEPHPQLHNLMTVVVSLSVTDVYKGQPQKSLVFRQYIWNVDSKRGVPEYRKGQELILLLRPVSEYGLTSPAGLEQGRFEVIARDKSRQKLAVNGRANLGLFDHIQEQARVRGMQLSRRSAVLVGQRRQGPVPAEALEDVIRTFARPH